MNPTIYSKLIADFTGLELTATPQIERGGGADPFKNVIYSYPLSNAMEDGFVKEPAFTLEEKATAYEAHVSKGFTTPRPYNYSAPADETERDFYAPVVERQDIRKMLFSGFKKCLYRVQKFDSDTERRFAVVLENDKEVLKWFKPAKGDFQIHTASDASYEPDFVVETKEEKYLCESKSAAEMEDRDVLEKAQAAAEWCSHATKHEAENGGKPWTYLLIPHDVITDNKTLKGLAASFTHLMGETGLP
jgi:type III restriction enzyme